MVGGEGEGGRPLKFPKDGCAFGGSVGPDAFPNPEYIGVSECLLVNFLLFLFLFQTFQLAEKESQKIFELCGTKRKETPSS